MRSVVQQCVILTVIYGIGAAGAVPVRGCGFDWSMPVAHFDGVEENGYVAYWEKIGEIDAGEAKPLPVYIGFNSHRESISPILGQGWIVPLLESHVEPVDENTVRVIMPDGWTYTFVRNGSTETWRGNAGWAGETNGARFAIAAPCGWGLKFDGGRLQEIDGAKAGPLTYRYDGTEAAEIDQNGRALLQVERGPGAGAALVLGDVRIAIAQAQMPRVAKIGGRNLIAALNASLSALTWNDGRQEHFVLGTNDSLDPTLTIQDATGTPRVFVWDADSRRIRSDNAWIYAFAPAEEGLRVTRLQAGAGPEVFETNQRRGVTIETGADAHPVATYRFVSGPLAGRVRKVVEDDGTKAAKVLYAASYYPSGNLLRESFFPDHLRIYSDNRELLKDSFGSNVDYEQELDERGRVVRTFNSITGTDVRRKFEDSGAETVQVCEHGAVILTEIINANNQLVTLEENTK